MALTTSLILIALGAILAFAVTTSVAGISISTVGVILMIVGAAGFVVSLLMTARHDDVAERHDRTVVHR